MPCRCTGVRKAKCDCDGDVFKFSTPTTVAQTPMFRHVRLDAKKHQFNSTIERLYEKCAAYNLRYCPFSGFVSNENYLSNTLKDFLILCCFMIANFVVFVTIVARLSVQIIFLILESAKWVRRAVAARNNKADDLTPHSTLTSPITSNHSRRNYINENIVHRVAMNGSRPKNLG